MNEISLKNRILLPLVIILSLLFTGFVVIVNHQQDTFNTVSLENASQMVRSHYQLSLNSHAEKMIGNLELMVMDDHIVKVLASGNRKQLLELGEPIFKQLLKLNITHFYFHTADRVNLLRVHQPLRFGDIIERTTAIEAVKKGDTYWGAELGPLGTFTLRVVKPVFVQGELVGLIELGEELEHFTTNMKSFFDVDIVVTMDKKFLKRSGWESGMAMMNRHADWDQFHSVVVSANSLSLSTTEFLESFIYPSHVISANHHHHLLNDKEYVEAQLPLFDANQQEVGKMFVLYDVTYLSNETNKATVTASWITGSLGLMLLLGFYKILSRTEHVIDDSQHQLLAERNALVENKAKLLEAQRLAHIGSWEMNLIHDTLWWSDECYLIFERDPEQKIITLADFLDCIHPEDREFVNHAYQQSLDNNTEYNIVHRLQMPDGRIKYVNEIGESNYDENNRPVSTNGTVQDITERYLADEALSQSRQHIDLLLNSTAEAVYGLDMDGTCTFANAACLRILGYNNESELMGHNMHDLTLHTKSNGTAYPRSECSLMNAVLNGHEVHIDDEVLWRKDGSSFPASYRSHPMQREDKLIGSVVTFLDITEQIRAKKELKISRVQLMASLEGTISTITKIVDTRDPYTSGHQQRVADLACDIAREMGLDEELIKGVSLGAQIHDIGKINVPAEILSKPTKLTDIEYMLIQSHSQIGYDILKSIKFPWPVADIAHQHHERMDGSGYPQGLKGSEIVLEARIVAVADVVEAMASHRPYRPGLGIDIALDEIKKNQGKFYDPMVVDACLRLFKDKGYVLS